MSLLYAFWGGTSWIIERHTHTHVNKVEDWSKVAAISCHLKRLVSLGPHPDIHALI